MEKERLSAGRGPAGRRNEHNRKHGGQQVWPHRGTQDMCNDGLSRICCAGWVDIDSTAILKFQSQMLGQLDNLKNLILEIRERCLATLSGGEVVFVVGKRCRKNDVNPTFALPFHSVPVSNPSTLSVSPATLVFTVKANAVGKKRKRKIYGVKSE